MSRHRTTAAALLVLLASWALAGTAGAAVPRLIFPIVASASYTNDFGAPRATTSHQGNDILAKKRSPVVAVEGGRVVKWTSSSSAGCMLYLHGRSGTTYMYIHLNNDKTSRNDNRGGCRNRIAYAPGLSSGQWVRAGQLIGYVGDSGDANGIASHLHFEVHPNGGGAVSPYTYLRRAREHLYPRPRADASKTLKLRMHGRVLATDVDRNPQRIRIKVNRVWLPNKWMIRPARNLTLSLTPETVLRRRTASKTSVPTPLENFAADDRVTVVTNDFADTRASAEARSGRHTIRTILIRLPK